MNFIIRYVILLFLLLFKLSIIAQDAQQCVAIAKDLYHIGEYEEAISLYRRVLYFDESLAVDSYFNIGESYMSIKDHDRARYYFSLAEHRETNDSIKLEIWFRTVASYILDDKAIYAKNELLSYSLGLSDYFDSKYLFYQGVVAFKLDDMNAADIYFSELFSEEHLTELNHYIKEGQKIISKRPYTALAMSAVLPGSGQAYAGEWMDAANSFFINILTTSLYVYIWHEYAYIDALLAVMPWWHRYYVGGFMNARDLVIDKRSDKLNAILTDILLLYSITIQE